MKPSARSVLVVDDDVDIRETLSELLASRGLDVMSAANGAQALELLRSVATLPSVILLDLMMPIMDGYQFLEESTRDPSLASIPVVVITAGHGIDRGRLSGAANILRKPVDVALLLNVIHDLRSGRESAP